MGNTHDPLTSLTHTGPYFICNQTTKEPVNCTPRPSSRPGPFTCQDCPHSCFASHVATFKEFVEASAEKQGCAGRIMSHIPAGKKQLVVFPKINTEGCWSQASLDGPGPPCCTLLTDWIKDTPLKLSTRRTSVDCPL